MANHFGRILVCFVAFLVQSNAAAQSLTLGTNSLTFGPESGSGTLVIGTGGTWTASTGDSWLHISPENASGTGSSLFRFTYDANTGTSRTGSVTFNGSEATLSVTQAGSTYVATIDDNLLTSSFLLSGIAMDDAGNLYFADSGQLKEWIAATRQVSLIVRFGVNGNWGVGLDGGGNLYFSAVNDTVQKWTKSTGRVTTVVPSRPGVSIGSITADAQGNVYVWARRTDGSGDSLEEWPANSEQVITVASGLRSSMLTLTTDASGNLYVTDATNNLIQRWTPSTGQVTTLVSTASPIGIGLDAMGNVYFSSVSRPFTSLNKWSAQTGQVTILGNPSSVNGLTVSKRGDVLYTNNGHQAIEVWTVGAVGPGTVVASPFRIVSALTADATGNVYFLGGTPVDMHLYKWTAETGEITTLISSGLFIPSTLALDASGNVYIADFGSLKKWTAQTGEVTTLVFTNLFNDVNMAVDSSGNVYITDSAGAAIKQWNAQTGQLTTLIASGLSMPMGVALDAAGNVYIADFSRAAGIAEGAIKKWTAVTGQLTTLVPFRSSLYPTGNIAVDGAGNVYFAVQRGIREWVAATGQVLAFVFTTGQTFQLPNGLGLDGNRNVYYYAGNSINRLTRGWVSLSDITEPLTAGSDQLPPVLPLGTPLEPSSDQPWLEIGDQVNGALGFSFNSATAPRAGHISVLGREITIAQGQLIGPKVISYSVVWGSQAYEITGSKRDRMPWQITGIRAVFSEPVFSSSAIAALNGIPFRADAVNGNGTNTLTWTISAVSAGSFALDLAKTGKYALTDLAGNALIGNATQNLTVLYGDITDDGVVDGLDVTRVNLARFGPYTPLADMNGDGVVDARDVQMVQGQIGSVWP